MKHLVVSLVLCAAIVGAGWGAVRLAPVFRNTTAQAEALAPAKAVSVKVQIIQPSLVEDRLVLTGTVEPWEDILVSAEARGKIERQGVKEGQRVKTGEELVRIDTSLLLAQRDQAEAQHKLAEQELGRAKSLSIKGIATGQAMDKSSADHDMAEANVRLVQIQLDKSVVNAPIDGVVDTLFKDENELIDMGMPLVRLVRVDKVKVRVGIPERDISDFAQGNQVTVALDSLSGREFPGTIHKIGTTAEAATLTFITEIEVDNAEGLIKPGMVARVALVRKSYPDAITIPMFSILAVENMRFVFVESGGVAHGRPIEVGVLQGDHVQVTKGLAAGERLIVAGQRELKDGDPVNALEEAEGRTSRE